MPRVRRSARDTPAMVSGSTTLSSTLALGLRKNCWKTKPKARLRVRLSSCWPSRDVSTPSSVRVPLVGRSRRASRCMSVDLPDPLLPRMDSDSPSAMSRSIPLSASNVLLPDP